MRFSLFVHMERSDPAKPHTELFAESEELVLMAEEAGFEAAWIGEHHAMEFTIARRRKRSALAPAPSSRRSGIPSSWPARRHCVTSRSAGAWISASRAAPIRSNKSD